jgi:hypothetical protein
VGNRFTLRIEQVFMRKDFYFCDKFHNAKIALMLIR